MPLAALTLSFGDATQLPITVHEATFTTTILSSQKLALVRLQLVACNDKSANSIEATFRLPLPLGAVVSGFELEDKNGRIVPATSVPKAKAAAVAYKEKEAGRSVATASVVQGSTWQTTVYPLPSHQMRKIAITFMCKLEAGELLIPLRFEQPVPQVRVVTTVLDAPGLAAVDNLDGSARNTVSLAGCASNSAPHPPIGRRSWWPTSAAMN